MIWKNFNQPRQVLLFVVEVNDTDTLYESAMHLYVNKNFSAVLTNTCYICIISLVNQDHEMWYDLRKNKLKIKKKWKK